MRLRPRVDANQAALVALARAFGASYLSMAALGNGAPDCLLGLHGTTFLCEFKTEDGTLTEDQHAFIRTWRGSPIHVVRTAEDMARLLKSVIENKRTRKPVVKSMEIT